MVHHVPAAAIAGMTAVPVHGAFIARAAHLPARRFTFLSHHRASRARTAFGHHRTLSILAAASIAALARIAAGVAVTAAGAGVHSLGVWRRRLCGGLSDGRQRNAQHYQQNKCFRSHDVCSSMLTRQNSLANIL